jgi:hypothetical protein
MAGKKYYLHVSPSYEDMIDIDKCPKEYTFDNIGDVLTNAEGLVERKGCCVTIFTEESRFRWKWIVVSPYKDDESVIDDPDNQHRFRSFKEALPFMEEQGKAGYNVAVAYDYGDDEE